MKGIRSSIRRNKYLNWILIVSNWFSQGIIHADKTEKMYKIFFTIIFWSFFYILFLYLFSYSYIKIGIFSFITAHTLNWIVNGNFYNLIIHRLLLDTISKTDLFNYIEDLAERVIKEKWILYVASFGSICNGDLKDSSDVDISIVRKPGFKNAIRAIWFSVKEKKLADYRKIPLELYISDSPENSRNRFKAEQNPVIIYDPYNTIDRYYNDKLTIAEAEKLNDVE